MLTCTAVLLTGGRDMPTKLPDDFKGAKPRARSDNQKLPQQEELGEVGLELKEHPADQRMRRVLRVGLLIIFVLATIYFFW